MPDSKITEAREALLAMANHYGQRLTPRVAEDSGGCFDISLEVGRLSVGCIRLGSAQPFMVYRGVGGAAKAMDRLGNLVDLPE